MRIDLNEEQAQWIRVGLLCYRNTCDVPANFGSVEFQEKSRQIHATIEWFDEEVANAKFWEGKTVEAIVDDTSSGPNLADVQKELSFGEPKTRCMACNQPVFWLRDPGEPMRWLHSHQRSADGHEPVVRASDAEEAERLANGLEGPPEAIKLLSHPVHRESVYLTQRVAKMTRDIGEICAMIEEWEDKTPSFPSVTALNAIKKHLVEKGYME